MTRVTAWVGAGVFATGVSAAVLLGAGSANAADDGGSNPDSTRAAGNVHTQRPQHQDPRSPTRQAKSENARSTAADKKVMTKRLETAATAGESDLPPGRLTGPAGAKIRTAVRDSTGVSAATAPSDVGEHTDSPARRESLAAAAPATNGPVEVIHDVLRSLGGLALNPEPQHHPAPLSVLSDVVFNTLATLERLVGGGPVVPRELRDKVEVSTSTLVISPGHEVESNWYFPTDGSTPTRLIYLQHGFLANGPLYSYTASYLAAQTGSIVVTTTFSSNPFEADGMWLGGDTLHQAVAQLFLDPDRRALNASMNTAELKAGQAVDIALPTEFVLVGHSLGGGFAPGVAGYYAAGLIARREAGDDAPNDLAGVVTYDAVPMGSIIPDAMERLDTLEANGTPGDTGDDNPDDYIPIYEIGAPLNYLNVSSHINDQLTAGRPGQFTGVVLEGGVHMDPMQGGNPLIQAAAYLIAGFPQPQNPLAVRELSTGWINDMFDDKIDPATGRCKVGAECAGLYGDGGDSFAVDTAEGDAVAVLIGSRRATDLTSPHAISLTDFVTAIPAGVLNGLETTCDLFSQGRCPV